MSVAALKLRGIPSKTLYEQVARLNSIPGAGQWHVQSEGESSALNVAYNFKSFAMTWKFLNGLLSPIQKLRHHPTITTTYNAVSFSLTTHDLGNKVSLLDLRLALIIADHYGKMGLMGVEHKPDSVAMSLTEANTILHELMLDVDPIDHDKLAETSNGFNIKSGDLEGVETVAKSSGVEAELPASSNGNDVVTKGINIEKAE